MSTVTELFDEYCAYLDEKLDHPKILDNINPPAAAAQIDRLVDALDGDVPDELVEWYRCHNGMSRDHRRAAGNLFACGEPLSVEEGLAFLNRDTKNQHWLARQPEMFDLHGGYIPRRPYPLVASFPEAGLALLVECDGKDGKVTTYDIEDGSTTGYYHRSIVGYLEGTLRILKMGSAWVFEGKTLMFDWDNPSSELSTWSAPSFGFGDDQVLGERNSPPRVDFRPGRIRRT